MTLQSGVVAPPAKLEGLGGASGPAREPFMHQRAFFCFGLRRTYFGCPFLAIGKAGLCRWALSRGCFARGHKIVGATTPAPLPKGPARTRGPRSTDYRRRTCAGWAGLGRGLALLDAQQRAGVTGGPQVVKHQPRDRQRPAAIRAAKQISFEDHIAGHRPHVNGAINALLRCVTPQDNR